MENRNAYTQMELRRGVEEEGFGLGWWGRHTVMKEGGGLPWAGATSHAMHGKVGGRQVGSICLRHANNVPNHRKGR